MSPRLPVALLSGVVLALTTTRAAAETWQAPVGGKPVAVEGRVVCPGGAGDWSVSVPIANRSLATETSINLHAWLEYEVSRDLGNGGGSPFAFVFGPSISIGNIRTNL